MKGYWNKKEETEKALMGGWMHTGDAGRMDEEGFVYIQDRIKDMIVSGGENIYSTEVGSIYYFSNGWHIKGCYSVIIGFIFSASTIWNPNLMFLQSFAWIIGAFISSITYYLLAKK